MPQPLLAPTPTRLRFTARSRVALISAVLLLCGCLGGEREVTVVRPQGGGSGSPATATGGEKTIGVSLLTLDNPFFKVIGDNITSCPQ